MTQHQPGGPIHRGQPYIMPPGQLPPKPGQPSQPSKKRRWVPFVAYPAVFIVGTVIGASAGPTPASDAGASSQPTATVTIPGPAVTETTTLPPQPAKTVTQGPPAAAAVMKEDGIYLVGTDIKPGTYRNGNEGDCYWARLRNLNGDLDSIIANNNGGNQVVTIKKTDKAFETTMCGEWRKIS